MDLREFKGHIKLLSEEQEIEKDKAFLDWYGRIRARDYKQEQPGNGDAEIDLVLFGPMEVILVQGKFGRAKVGDVRAFHDTILAWKNQESFRRWRQESVTNESARRCYTRVFKQCFQQKKTLVWEFVSLDRFKNNWQKILERGTDGKFPARVVSAEELVYFFRLGKVGAAYTEPIKIKTHGDYLSYQYGQNKTINTYACVVKLPSLLKVLKNMGDMESVFARNVRLEISGSEVNKDMRRTYKKSPETFFFGNNGIHILCTKTSFRAGEVEIEHPSVINGGQTLRTLVKEPIQSDAKILTRITEMPRNLQITKEYQEFIDDIIFRSNSNNDMKPWNLRSNDEIQVELAKKLQERNLYYERKDYEWKYEKAKHPKIKKHIHSVTLAQLMAVCDDLIGPAKLKYMGRHPLFRRTKQGGYYETLFRNLVSNINATETMIRMYFLVRSSVNNAKRIPDDYETFKNAAVNYVLGVIWRAIENADLDYPLQIPIRGRKMKKSALAKEVARITTEMFKLFKKYLQKGVTQNDIFRKEEYWRKAKKKFLGPKWRAQIVSATKRTISQR